jgi:hypothetical protein
MYPGKRTMRPVELNPQVLETQAGTWWPVRADFFAMPSIMITVIENMSRSCHASECGRPYFYNRYHNTRAAARGSALWTTGASRDERGPFWVPIDLPLANDPGANWCPGRITGRGHRRPRLYREAIVILSSAGSKYPRGFGGSAPTPLASSRRAIRLASCHPNRRRC